MARILVIDDDQNVRSVLGRMLMRAGHDVLEAANGPAGIHALHAASPVDLVIVDIFMPGQGGLTTIQQVRTEWPALKIVAMSGADRTRAMDLAKRAAVVGADHFLGKPFEATTLLEIVGAALATNARPSPPD